MLKLPEVYLNGDLVYLILNELHQRALAAPLPFRNMYLWDQERVNRELQRFSEVARSVANNKRTSYSAAGRGKVAQGSDHPDAFYIDSYCAMKRDDINAIFCCKIKRRGDAPIFEIQYFDQVIQTFAEDQLDAAFQCWVNVASMFEENF